MRLGGTTRGSCATRFLAINCFCLGCVPLLLLEKGLYLLAVMVLIPSPASRGLFSGRAAVSSTQPNMGRQDMHRDQKDGPDGPRKQKGWLTCCEELFLNLWCEWSSLGNSLLAVFRAKGFRKTWMRCCVVVTVGMRWVSTLSYETCSDQQGDLPLSRPAPPWPFSL